MGIPRPVRRQRYSETALDIKNHGIDCTAMGMRSDNK